MGSLTGLADAFISFADAYEKWKIVAIEGEVLDGIYRAQAEWRLQDMVKEFRRLFPGPFALMAETPLTGEAANELVMLRYTVLPHTLDSMPATTIKLIRMIASNTRGLALAPGLAGIDPAVPSYRLFVENDPKPRDQYIYEQRVAGVELKALLKTVNATYEDELDTVQAVSQAAKRYAIDNSKPWPVR